MRRSPSNSCRSWSGVRALALAALVAGLLANGCAAKKLTRSLITPGEVQTLDRRSAYLKVHAKDGQLYVLSEWRADETARQISGRGDRLNLARETLETGPFTVSLDDVALIETNVVQPSPAVAALAVVTGISAAVTAFCIAQPKTCFGSVPYLLCGLPRMDARRVVVGREPVAGGATHAESGAAAPGRGP